MLRKWIVAAAVVASAVPFSAAVNAQALEELESNLFDKAKPGSEKIYLGFVGDDVKDKEPAGVEVIEVVNGSPAEMAGFKQGDVVFNFADQRVKSSAELGAALQGLKPGDQVRVSLVRAQRQINTTLTLGSRGEVQADAPVEAEDKSVLLPDPSDLGPADPVEVIPSPDDRELNLDNPADTPATNNSRPVRGLIQGFLGGRGATDVDVEEVGELVDGILGGSGRVRVRVGQPAADAAAPAEGGRVRVRVGNPDGIRAEGAPVPAPGGVRVRVGNTDGVPAPPAEGGVRVRVGNPDVGGPDVDPVKPKTDLALEVQLLREEVLRLRARVDELEKRIGR
jgi:hypothetical protein